MVSSEQSPGAPVPHSSSHTNVPQPPAPETAHGSPDFPDNHRETYRSVLDDMIRAAETGDAQVPSAGDGVRQRMVQAARNLGNQPSQRLFALFWATSPGFPQGTQND